MTKMIRLRYIIGALTALIIVGGFLYYYISPPVLFKKSDLKGESVPPADSRILVFAPHCDDETLGTGMLIHRALKTGSNVKVILVTNSDGFKFAVDENFITLHPTNREFKEFGRQRQRESVAALKRLGLGQKDIIFLEYPDEGTSHLWTENWDPDKRYFSKYTRTDISPYKNSYDRKAPYTGVSLLSDIKKVVSEYKPDYIYYPHPNDRHPDHWAVHAFVKYALEEERMTNVKERLYLVHRSNWPQPKMALPEKRLVPPKELINTGTIWREFELTALESRLKEEAILLYKTQVRAMKPFLLAFVRSSELFGEYPDFQIASDNKATGSGRDLAIFDPGGDFLSGDIDKAADITGVYSFLKDNRVVLELAAGQPVNRSITYNLHIRLFPHQGEVRRIDLEYRGGKLSFKKFARNSLTAIDDLKIRELNGRLQVAIPVKSLGGLRAVFVSADCSLGRYPTDKTAWRMLKL